MSLIRRLAFMLSMSFAIHLTDNGTLGAAVAGACIAIAAFAAIPFDQ